METVTDNIMNNVKANVQANFEKSATTGISAMIAKVQAFVENEANKPYLMGGAVLVALYIAFGYAGQILCNIIGVAYPTYISMKAIESKPTADDTKWLTYWVLFSCFTIFEQIFVFVTNFIPLYWLIKCIFYIWCMAPIENNGSVYLYHKVIRPHFLKHENAADDLINNAFDKAKKAATEIISKKGD